MAERASRLGRLQITHVKGLATTILVQFRMPERHFQSEEARLRALSSADRIREELRSHSLPRNFRFSRSAALQVAEGILLAPSEAAALLLMRGDVAGTASLLLLWEHFEGKVKGKRLTGSDAVLAVPYYDFASWIIESTDRENWVGDQLPVLDGRPALAEA